MEEIYHNKFSLFQLEKTFILESFYGGDAVTKPCFELIGIFDSLKDAKIAKEKIKEKSIILASYE